MDYSTIAQPWSQSPSQIKRLPIDPNPSFFYKHHPKNWELVAITEEGTGKRKTTTKFYFLPQLHDHPEQAGVAGTRGMGQNVDSTLAKAQAVSDGWTILDPEHHDYLRIYPTTRGGSYHSNKWTKLEDLGGDVVKTFDKVGHAIWRRELVQKGIIKLPHHSILQKKIYDLERSIQRKIPHQHLPQIKQDIEHIESLKDIMVQTKDKIAQMGVKAYD